MLLGFWDNFLFPLTGKHLKLEGKAELLTFALATISSRLCCSNYLLFGKLFFAVAPFLSNFD